MLQDARRAAYLSQQAAEQAAMRDYLRSLPPQARAGRGECNAGHATQSEVQGAPLGAPAVNVMHAAPARLPSPRPQLAPASKSQKCHSAAQVVWEDEAAAQAARDLARAQGRQARHASRPHPPGHGPSSHRSSRGPSSHTAGTSAAGSYTTGTSAPLSEAEYSMSEASAAATEIEPAAGGTRQQARALASQGSLDARAAAGGGAALRPEALQRAAAKVQSGSPRRSAVRAKGPFATKVGVAENE